MTAQLSADCLHLMYKDKGREALMGGEKVPSPVMTMFWILIDQCAPKRLCGNSNKVIDSDNNRRLMDIYRANFGSGMHFVVPTLSPSVEPDPGYHSIQGQSFYFLQWELQEEGFWMKCPVAGCCGRLLHD